MERKPVQTIDLEFPKVPSFSNPFKFLFFHAQQCYRYWRTVINVRIGEWEYRRGKAKILHSFSDLDKL